MLLKTFFALSAIALAGCVAVPAYHPPGYGYYQPVPAVSNMAPPYPQVPGGTTVVVPAPVYYYPAPMYYPYYWGPSFGFSYRYYGGRRR